jgi:hypothetical protein
MIIGLLQELIMNKRKLPFECMILDNAPVKVTNPFSGESIMLEPDEVAVYDSIMGANMTGNYKMVEKGCAWFAKHNIEAYMTLLD